MTKLPKHIKERFFKTIKGDISIQEFEQWLYADNELEPILESGDYLDLISFSFKRSGAKYELWNLLKKHIDIGEFETYKLLELFYEAKHQSEKLPFILMDFYELYCKGLIFLREIGLRYGLSVVVPRMANVKADTWEELTESQQKRLLDSFTPNLENEIDKVIDWLETKKIIINGERDEIGYYVYDDFRTDEEGKSDLWTEHNFEKDLSYLKKNDTKKWWKFW